MHKAPDPLACEHCTRPIGVVQADGTVVYRIASRALVCKGAAVQTKCHHCGRQTRVGLLMVASGAAPAGK